MSLPAGQHIRFVDPLPSPPANRPRRPGLKYPSVAQRKDVPDRMTSPDLAWPGPRPLSRTNLSITPFSLPTPSESSPHSMSWEDCTIPDIERPQRPPSMSISDSLRGLFSFARGNLMSLSPSPSKHSLDSYPVERPRLFLRCGSADSRASSSPSSTICESDSSAVIPCQARRRARSGKPG
ncbi:uncharacterized protein PHACADRAFT_204506 [Phanerochaete carnosa HHB-10118-sp]|uniref:Uncharacterized protein n=1 Tax=Phanerochaete carnosa (strain HHB-10118-sp) TaxID=650164 RepID=K5WBN7_PHACS|nr:uncharacterized protein PHACADRAFT_204506 [Phanerochaete carnosa HHB-10118-sp]EKM61338.1 hypothetical protein PHACADRAFT_204506 [Phanerochaete carnosa HHB-10118-sp]